LTELKKAEAIEKRGSIVLIIKKKSAELLLRMFFQLPMRRILKAGWER